MVNLSQGVNTFLAYQYCDVIFDMCVLFHLSTWCMFRLKIRALFITFLFKYGLVNIMEASPQVGWSWMPNTFPSLDSSTQRKWPKSKDYLIDQNSEPGRLVDIDISKYRYLPSHQILIVTHLQYLHLMQHYKAFSFATIYKEAQKSRENGMVLDFIYDCIT